MLDLFDQATDDQQEKASGDIFDKAATPPAVHLSAQDVEFASPAARSVKWDDEAANTSSVRPAGSTRRRVPPATTTATPPSLSGSPQDIAARALKQTGLPPAVPPASPKLRVHPNLDPSNTNVITQSLESGSTPVMQTEGEARQFDAERAALAKDNPSPLQIAGRVAAPVLEGAPNDAGPAGSGFPLLQGVPNIAGGTENLVAGKDRQARYTGGAQIISGTMDELMPAFTAGLIEKPVQVGAGLITGALTAQGAQLATNPKIRVEPVHGPGVHGLHRAICDIADEAMEIAHPVNLRLQHWHWNQQAGAK